jgi:hypothetical protein
LPGAERFGIGLVVDPARARITQPKSRPHVVRTEMEMIEVSTGNIVEFGMGKKSTEASSMQHWPNWSTARRGGPTSRCPDALRCKQVLTLMTAHADEWVATGRQCEEWTSGPPNRGCMRRIVCNA